MPYNGSGSFSRVHNWQQDSANNIDITDSRCDAEDDGFATGLSTAICRDGQSTITNDIPFANHKITGLANGTVRTDAAAVGQVQDGTTNWVAAGGTADAITATYSPAHTALVDGMICWFRASAANATTTPTFSPDGLTAHTITKKGGSALLAGDIPAALAEIVLRYNLANTRWELLNPAPHPAQVVSTITGALATGTTVIPGDDTTPQNTEGDQYMSLSITPTNAASKLVIAVSVNLSPSSLQNIVAALFQDSGAGAIAAWLGRTDGLTCISGTFEMTAGTTSATTFKLRAGPTSAATLTFNGSAGARLLGGILSSSIVITEILP